jgi:hypothetical protein
MCCGFEPARQTALELKPHYCAMAKPTLAHQKDHRPPASAPFFATGEVRPAALAAQAGDTHDLQILIEYWLAHSDGHVLDATELMHTHDLQ